MKKTTGVNSGLVGAQQLFSLFQEAQDSRRDWFECPELKSHPCPRRNHMAEKKSSIKRDSEEESIRLRKLEDVRAPIIDEVLAENPGLTKEKLRQMMDEMGF